MVLVEKYSLPFINQLHGINKAAEYRNYSSLYRGTERYTVVVEQPGVWCMV